MRASGRQNADIHISSLSEPPRPLRTVAKKGLGGRHIVPPVVSASNSLFHPPVRRDRRPRLAVNIFMLKGAMATVLSNHLTVSAL